MQNTTILNPHIASALARDHQETLLSAARRVNTPANWTGHPGAVDGLRRALGTLLVRTGTRVAGCQPATTLVRQPAL